MLVVIAWNQSLNKLFGETLYSVSFKIRSTLYGVFLPQGPQNMIIVDKFNKSKKPGRIDIIEKNIPDQIKDINQWVCWFWYWDGKKWTKPPCDKSGYRLNHLESTMTYKEAITAYKNNKKLAGIGYSIRKEDPICGIDFDDVIKENGKFTKRLKKSLELLEGTYIEKSPGGRGIRVFGVGNPKTRGSSKNAREIEIYNSGRYLTLTGHKVSRSTRLINIEKQTKRIDKKIYKIKIENNSVPGNLEELQRHENQDPKLTKLRSFLFKYDPNDRNKWYRCGMVIHYETNNSLDGYNLWLGWSSMSTAGNYSEEACQKTWKSFKKTSKSQKPLTLASFYYEEKKRKSINGRKLSIVNHKDLEREKIKPPKNILNPWFMEGSINMVHAKRGLGKTHFCLATALALSTGGKFLNWKADKVKKVLYIDGEMPLPLLMQFLSIQKEATGLNPKGDNLHFINIDKQKDGIFPSLSEEDGRDLIEDAISQIRPDVIIFDSIATCFKIDESAGNYWAEIQDWLVQLRSKGIDILLVHHDNKSGNAQNGKSDKERIMNAIIHLKEPKGVKSNKSARFQVIFSKKRHFWGEDAEQFEARLNSDSNQWEVASSEFTTREMVVKMIKEGNKPAEISQAIGVSIPSVRTHAKNAMEDGDLHETELTWTTRRRRK